MRSAWGAAIAVVFAASGAAAQTFAPGSEAVALRNAAFSYKSAEIRLPGAAASKGVNAIRIDVAQALKTPVGVFDPNDVDVTLTRSWPSAVSISGEKLDVDLTPRLGVGAGKAGTSASAGARIEFSPHPRQDRAVEAMQDMGIRDGSTFGGAGRWYLFAAADGRAVGLNMLRNGWDFDRAGWTTDSTGALVGDAQIGVGWRKGDAQSSFGIIHREVRGNHMIFGQGTKQDTVAAFTFSIKPER